MRCRPQGVADVRHRLNSQVDISGTGSLSEKVQVFEQMGDYGFLSGVSARITDKLNNPSRALVLVNGAKNAAIL